MKTSITSTMKRRAARRRAKQRRMWRAKQCRMWERVAGCVEINEYVLAQNEKGLVFEISRYWHNEMKPVAGFRLRVNYQTYQNTHREVILPEIKRLAVKYGLSGRVQALPLPEVHADYVLVVVKLL